MVNEHRNIVTFYGFCMDKNEMCLVFEWADKGDLRNFLANKVLDWPQRYKIASEIAFGLKYIHNKDIVHRDLHSKTY